MSLPLTLGWLPIYDTDLSSAFINSFSDTVEIKVFALRISGDYSQATTLEKLSNSVCNGEKQIIDTSFNIPVNLIISHSLAVCHLLQLLQYCLHFAALN